MYELYELKISDINKLPKIDTGLIIEKYEFGMFKPSVLRLCLSAKTPSISERLVNFYWYLITFGRLRIYYLKDGGEFIHTSYCIPKCYKFPFMGAKDLQIGPCVTNEKYRGQGIYPYVLSRIVEDLAKPDVTFYMIIDDKNLPSQRGVYKVGFIKSAKLVKDSCLKIYRISRKLKVVQV